MDDLIVIVAPVANNTVLIAATPSTTTVVNTGIVQVTVSNPASAAIAVTTPAPDNTIILQPIADGIVIEFNTKAEMMATIGRQGQLAHCNEIDYIDQHWKWSVVQNTWIPAF